MGDVEAYPQGQPNTKQPHQGARFLGTRYVIYGAGAIGASVGGLLALAGHEVCLIARGAHLETLRSDGLTLVTPQATHNISIPTVGTPIEARLGRNDVVFMTMKSQHTMDALGALKASAPDGLSVVCAQNGVANETMALRWFANVYAMVVNMPSAHIQPGVVEASGSPVAGVLDVGRYPSGVDEVAESLASALTSSNIRSATLSDVMRYKYAKLRFNTVNGLDAACGPSSRQSDLAKQARAEALAVYRAANIDFADQLEVDTRIGDLRSVPVEGKQRSGSSSWQSLKRQTGSIESDYLSGEIVLLGRLHGVPTPVNQVLTQLGNDMAREGLPPGSYSLDYVETLVNQVR